MKKKVKFILLGVVVLVIIGMVTVNVLQPLAVEVLMVEPTHAQVIFTERGYVREDRVVDVYAFAGGKILSVNVLEGQTILEGETIAVVDSSGFFHEIEQIKVNKKAILAQIDNLEAEEAKLRDSQRASKSALQGELNSTNAKEQMARISDMDQRQARDENIRLQNIMIEQSQRDVQNAEIELERANMLYDVGAISRVEHEASAQTLEDLKTALTANEQKLSIISSQTNIVDQSEYYSALKSSIRAQIDGIDSVIKASYSEPMRQYYQTQIESGNLKIENLERMISESTITSPVTGTIESLPIDSTNVVNVAMPVARIKTETDDMVEVLVSTSNIDDIQVGDSVELVFTRYSGDTVHTGTIHSIDDRARVVVSALGVEERRVEVRIKPEISDESFRSGYDVNVRFVTYSSDNRIVVPRTAVYEEEGQNMLYLVQNGKVVATSVKLGVQLKSEVVVESGIGFGDLVIRNANHGDMKNGAKVSYK